MIPHITISGFETSMAGELKLHSASAWGHGSPWTQILGLTTKHGGESCVGTWRRREGEVFLLRETMQFCDGAMKSLRSDACSTGENLLDDIVGRPGGAPIGSLTVWGGLLRLRDYRNQSALDSFGTGGGCRRGCRPPRIAPRRGGRRRLLPR